MKAVEKSNKARNAERFPVQASMVATYALGTSSLWRRIVLRSIDIHVWCNTDAERLRRHCTVWLVGFLQWGGRV
jgi:hypothetical protein